MEKHYQVIIVGGGPAGLSAALWCCELGLRTVLLEAAPELGGQLLKTFNPIKNHLGIAAENGKEMRNNFLRQIAEFEPEIILNCEILKLDILGKRVEMKSGAVFTGDFLILATGVSRRKLGLPNEAEFVGRGIIQSGKNEAHTAKHKRVCIVGGGDAALENALILAEFAESVILVHRREEFSARKEFIEKVLLDPRISVIRDTIVTSIRGEGKLEAVSLQNIEKTETRILPTDILLIRIGVKPNTEDFSDHLEADSSGYCQINSCCETNVEGVFAIGDIANPLAPTISSATGMGATAAKVIASRIT